MAKYIKVVFNIPVKAIYTYENIELENNNNPFGCRIEANLGRRKIIGFVVDQTDVEPTEFKVKPIIRYIDEEPLFNKKLLDLAKWVADFTMCSIGEALSAMLPGGKREKSLPELAPEDIPEHKAVDLSNEQELAIDTVIESFNSKDSKNLFYVYGITGSGKTEVFLNIAEHVLEKGLSVIYLVPEISLTHQVIETLRSRFTQGIGVLHSHLTPSQRLKEWRRIQSGDAKLVIGARSAVYAPCSKLGLIIIDEEHENSYKSGNTPRYSARQVAMKRIKLEKAKLLMGSATPSLESWKLMNDGVIKRLTLTKRLSGGVIPKSQIVDMRKEEGILSKLLIDKINQTYDECRQTILFLNRRGFSYFFRCNSCGYEMLCKNCSVSLTYHKHKNKMICHYCGYQAHPINVCPECKSLDIGATGFGTEHIEEEVQNLFPKMVVRRLDTDTTTKKGELKKTLDSFKKGQIDILIGTQMVARGLNFPGVKLVGIVMADTGLKMPDFRASERAFGLISQVSGRAGRYSKDGEVVIQTLMPQNRAINLAASNDIETFYKEELNTREILEFPPYSRLIRLVFRSKQLNGLLHSINEFADKLNQLIVNDGEILGPSECPLSIIAGNNRHQILIRTNSLSKIHTIVYSLLNKSKFPSNIYIEIDVDPISLL